MISKTLPTEIILYDVNNKCDWLEDTCNIFQKININVLNAYHKIIRLNNTFVNKTAKDYFL